MPTSILYDAIGRQTQLVWPDGFHVDYDYHVTGELRTIRENGPGGAVLASFGYDDLGRRTQLARGNGTATSYVYTGPYLTSQSLTGAGSAVTWGFAYNPAGQIVSRTGSNDAYAWTGHYNVNRSYAANGLNQYSQIASSATINPLYDARGNLISAGGPYYAYNSLNQLTGTNSGFFNYEVLGRLSYGSVAQLYMDYDGERLVSEYSAASGNPLLRRYVFGPGYDEPILWYEGTGTSDKRYLAADERGSIVQLSNGSGGLIQLNAYDEYGIPASGNTGRFQYTGQAWMPELGMYNYKARTYSPTLGRFMQTDPIGYGDGLNWYAYVKNDPVNGSDPSGLKPYEDYQPCTGSRIHDSCGGGGIAGGLSGFSSAYVGGSAATQNNYDAIAGAAQYVNNFLSDSLHTPQNGLQNVSLGSGILGDLYEEYDNALTIGQLGRLGEEAAAAAIVAQGYTITGVQVRVQTPVGLRIMDYTALGSDGPHAFEVKVNNSPYSQLQSQKDNLIYGGNGVSAGYLNPSFPYGSRYRLCQRRLSEFNAGWFR